MGGGGGYSLWYIFSLAIVWYNVLESMRRLSNAYKQSMLTTVLFFCILTVSKLVCRRPRLKLTCLPDEILLKILSYVPTYDLVQNVARVSKHFHHLTRDPDAHVSITFTNHVNTDKVVAFLKNKRKVLDSKHKGSSWKATIFSKTIAAKMRM
jgi:hypothetical protein